MAGIPLQPRTTRGFEPAGRGNVFALHTSHLAERNGILQFFFTEQVGADHGSFLSLRASMRDLSDSAVTSAQLYDVLFFFCLVSY